MNKKNSKKEIILSILLVILFVCLIIKVYYGTDIETKLIGTIAIISSVLGIISIILIVIGKIKNKELVFKHGIGFLLETIFIILAYPVVYLLFAFVWNIIEQGNGTEKIIAMLFLPMIYFIPFSLCGIIINYYFEKDIKEKMEKEESKQKVLQEEKDN